MDWQAGERMRSYQNCGLAGWCTLAAGCPSSLKANEPLERMSMAAYLM